MDLIITVCDNAAGETCPVWPGHPSMAHWGVPDPATVQGSHQDTLAAFERTYVEMEVRIKMLLEAKPNRKNNWGFGAFNQSSCDKVKVNDNE